MYDNLSILLILSKVEKYLKELFSFVPEGIIIKNVSEVEIFNRKIPARFLSHPLSGYFENDEEEGVFFKTKNGKEFHFLKEKGKAVQKPYIVSLMAPLPPYPCVRF